MTRTEKSLAALVVALALALPAISYYSYRTGYFLGKEIWRGSVVIIPPPQCEKPSFPPGETF